jgi:hypothetical protein
MFDWGLARNTDPKTSHDAAKSIDASRLEQIVLGAFKTAQDGLTQDELGDTLPNIPLNTLTPRIAPLIRKGYLEVSGRRLGRSGRHQRVVRFVHD